MIIFVSKFKEINNEKDFIFILFTDREPFFYSSGV